MAKVSKRSSPSVINGLTAGMSLLGRGYLLYVYFVLCFLPLSNIHAQPYQKVQVMGGQIPAQDMPWKLVFHDEFTTNELDTSKWVTYYPYDPQGSDQCTYCRTHGEEGQIYLDENVRVSKGKATLQIRPDTTTWMGATRKYSSGMIHTRSPWKFKYGRFEIRCKLPRGMGFWPAFWLYGWGGNEIDIFELGSQFPDLQYANIHRDLDGRHYYQGSQHYGPDYAADFHTFALEWDPWFVRWIVDGYEVRLMPRLLEQKRKKPVLPGTSLAPGVYLENVLMPQWPLDVIVNVAVGVTGVTPFTESPNAETVLPNQMEIDYIRVYQRQPQEGMKDLCAEGAITGPATLSNPALYRYTGPFTALSWATSTGLLILDRTTDGILVAAHPDTQRTLQWVEVVVDEDGQGPCTARTLRYPIGRR